MQSLSDEPSPDIRRDTQTPIIGQHKHQQATPPFDGNPNNCQQPNRKAMDNIVSSSSTIHDGLIYFENDKQNLYETNQKFPLTMHVCENTHSLLLLLIE